MKDRFAVINRDKKRHNFLKIIFSLFVSSLFLIVMQAVIQNGIDYYGYASFITSPLIPLLNVIPVFLVMAAFYFSFQKLKIAFICTSVPFYIMLAINHYKIYLRDDPFVPADLNLATEAVTIMQNYTVPIPWILILALILSALFYIFYVRRTNFYKYRWGVRVIGALSALSCLFASYSTIYQNTFLYDSIQSYANTFYSVSVVNHKGFLYSFLSKPSSKQYPKPENYSLETALEMLSDNAFGTAEGMPNVIAIMCESFFDIQKAPGIEFYDDMNPFANFNSFKEESLYGEMIVPGFAGSTSSTECEFLTGVNLYLADRSMPAVYNAFFRKEFYSVPTVFKSLGFKTTAIHPGYKWFYNRQNAYRYMGFDTFITVDDIPSDAERVNYYVSDNVTADLIIDDYKNHLAENPEQGYFGFTVTIQNHGPYPETQTHQPLRVVRDDEMSDETYHSLNNYVGGLYDSDVLLGRVRDYLLSVDTPTVLLFFGDHLPHLGSENEGYKAIGMDIDSGNIEAEALKHSVPYILWMNPAARDMAQSLGRQVPQGKNTVISSNFLPAEMFDYIGGTKPAFFDFLYKLKEKVSVIAPGYYVSGGEYVTQIPEETLSLLEQYKQLQYYNINEYKEHG